MSGQSPCVFPGCRDQNGDPRLTDQVICEPSRNHYRRLLDWLILDYVTLKSTMPKPAARGVRDNATKQTSFKAKVFGHPAEWASVTCSEIADALNWAEDGLRDELGHEPPPHPGVREAGRVAHAHAYMTAPAAFQALCTYDAAEDTAVELTDLHRKVRFMLGHTRRVERLPTPCPWCEVSALIRDVDQVECKSCGKIVDEKLYGWFTVYLRDQMLDEQLQRRASA